MSQEISILLAALRHIPGVGEFPCVPEPAMDGVQGCGGLCHAAFLYLIK